jgi:hypothetical protein
MEGHLSSAKLEKLYLPTDRVVIALRAGGELKILYGMSVGVPFLLVDCL